MKPPKKPHHPGPKPPSKTKSYEATCDQLGVEVNEDGTGMRRYRRFSYRGHVLRDIDHARLAAAARPAYLLAHAIFKLGQRVRSLELAVLLDDRVTDDDRG